MAKLNDISTHDMLNALFGQFDGGNMVFYDAPQPANAATAITTQIALANIVTLPTPAFAAAAGRAVANASQFTDPSVDTAGTSTWARMKSADGTRVIDLTVSGTGGAGEVQMGPDVNGNQLVLNVPVNVTAFNVNYPA